MSGTVEAICITSTKHGPQAQVPAARIVAGAGIEGDRYFSKAQRYPGQNLTLVESEEIERFNRENSANIPIDGTRRNIVTRGIRLNTLVGKEFTIGTVRLRGVELCEPCRVLGTNLASAEMNASVVVRKFVHKAGLRADALSGGTIRVGDEVAEVTPK
jgi:MOSC domain-containing protein YiiM